MGAIPAFGLGAIPVIGPPVAIAEPAAPFVAGCMADGVPDIIAPGAAAVAGMATLWVCVP